MAEGTGLHAPISAVTVFKDGARVRRSGTVSVEPGLRPVGIGDVRAAVEPASVGIAAGGRDLVLLNVEVHRRCRTDPLREETARLRSEAERCRDVVQALDDEDTTQQASLGFLGNLSEAAATALARALSFGRADHGDLDRMAGHLSASTATALERRRDIGARRRSAQRELEAAEQRLAAAEKRSGRPGLRPGRAGARKRPRPRAAGGAAPGERGAALPTAAPRAADPGEAGAGLVYRVPRPLDVPADGGPHQTLVARFELDAILDHLAVPALAPEAYLRATVTNSSSLLLLPGPARVFPDAQFVGQPPLETVAAGEALELQLGVDDQIRVERELRRRSTSKAVIGGARTIDIGYVITVENHRPNKATVSVPDHIPASTDGDLKVRLRDTSPNPAGQTDLGELTWDLQLDGGQAATIRHRFTVGHPAQATIAGP